MDTPTAKPSKGDDENPPTVAADRLFQKNEEGCVHIYLVVVALLLLLLPASSLSCSLYFSCTLFRAPPLSTCTQHLTRGGAKNKSSEHQKNMKIKETYGVPAKKKHTHTNAHTHTKIRK